MFVDELKTLLGNGKSYCDLYLKIREIPKGFELTYGQMFEAPPLTFGTLQKLSTLFGTDEIDVDNYSRGGCETCDWGSDYGHTIQIFNPTNNVAEAAEACRVEKGVLIKE